MQAIRQMLLTRISTTISTGHLLTMSPFYLHYPSVSPFPDTCWIQVVYPFLSTRFTSYTPFNLNL
jgi:hypothetical protein